MVLRERNVTGIGMVVTLLMILAFIYVITFGQQLVASWHASWWGIFVLVLAYAVSAAVTGSLNPLALAVGDDGRLSLSKAQTLFWTFIVLYAYAALYANDVRFCSGSTAAASACAAAAAARANPSGAPAAPNAPPGATTTTVTTNAGGTSAGAPAGGTTTTVTTNAGGTTTAGATNAGGTTTGANTTGAAPGGGGTTTTTTTANAAALGANALIPINFPGSVLLLLGFSVTSLIAAAGIARSQIASGVRAGQRVTTDLSPKWLVQSDDGRVDLTRFQVLLWTLVAAGVFVSDTQLLLNAGGVQLSLPDVGSALVLLMGLGQAAYVGGKLVVTPKPVIFRFSPAHAPVTPLGGVAVPVNVVGAGFGAPSPTSSLLMDGAPVPAANVTSWTDTLITFTVPTTQPGNGQAWPQPSATPNVSVAVGSAQSDEKPFTVP
jgi:hypothetical protein